MSMRYFCNQCRVHTNAKLQHSHRVTVSSPSARFWPKKLHAQVHTTQTFYVHNIVCPCTWEGFEEEFIRKHYKNSKIQETEWFGSLKVCWNQQFLCEFLSIWNLWLRTACTCACRLGNLHAQRNQYIHLCMCACVKLSTGVTPRFHLIYDLFNVR